MGKDRRAVFRPVWSPRYALIVRDEQIPPRNIPRVPPKRTRLHMRLFTAVDGLVDLLRNLSGPFADDR